MKLHEDVNKQFFIYDNVIDESLFDNLCHYSQIINPNFNTLLKS
jgi:hypothetical protein